jgi:hypothetical protein
MNFLPDVKVLCDRQRAALQCGDVSILWRGKSIGDLLR